ncbi:sensor histidine kinase [Paenibacillus sediminis]|uniref:histidine kinase n=1 Tax=Paenibacillus sediminis TaxID=664909 RepID=A0ABS4H410_9BACL|nr:sensor histidine kinase [Paenibacillus sediminis]MBP1937211.1 two-component system sensor histidine kinase DesK [Paenibacillus sediminis]
MKKCSFRLFPPAMGVMPYLWLIYWLMPVYYLFKLSHTSWEALFGLSLILIFQVAYRQSYWEQGARLLLWVTIEIAIIMTLAIHWDPNFLYVGFFTTAAIGNLRSKKMMLGAVAFLLVAFISTPFFSSNDYDVIGQLGAELALFVTLAIVPFGMRAARRYREMNLQIKDANMQIERLTKQEERQRIARDLHDTLGHTLSMISLKGQLAGKYVTRDPERAVQELKEIEEAARKALTQMRNLVSDMHMVNLQEELLGARQIAEAADIKLEVHGDIEAVQRQHSSLTCTILAMCLRECMTNVVKHSGASRCVITFTDTGTATQLEVADNGKWAHDQERKTEAIRQGHGLFGMRQRLELVEGILDMDPNAATGTIVTVTVPRIVSGNIALSGGGA